MLLKKAAVLMQVMVIFSISTLRNETYLLPQIHLVLTIHSISHERLNVYSKSYTYGRHRSIISLTPPVTAVLNEIEETSLVRPTLLIRRHYYLRHIHIFFKLDIG